MLALTSSLGACGDPKYQAPGIVVSFDSHYPIPASLDTGASTTVAADVANDTKNAGVTFSCVPSGACGTFTPPSAGAAIPVCYLAPAQVPAGNVVTVTATSVTDPTQFVSATIAIAGGAANPCP